MKKQTIYFLSFGAGLWLFAVTSLLLFQIVQKPTIGIIDTHALVAIEAKAVAEFYHNGNVPPEKLQKIAEKLKNSVDDFAKDRKLILFAKGAVWGGELPDFTDLMIEKLKKE